MKSYTPPPRARGSRFGACGIGGADFWVRTTENGEGAFVFCSEEVFQREIDDAVERALYAERVKDAVAKGYAALAGGETVEGTAAARAAVARMRAARG